MVDLLSIHLAVILVARSRSESVTHRLYSLGLAGRQIIEFFPVDLDFEDLGASIGRLDQFVTCSLDAAEFALEARIKGSDGRREYVDPRQDFLARPISANRIDLIGDLESRMLQHEAPRRAISLLNSGDLTTSYLARAAESLLELPILLRSMAREV